MSNVYVHVLHCANEYMNVHIYVLCLHLLDVYLRIFVCPFMCWRVRIFLRSILHKIDELRTFALTTKVAAIGVEDAWIDASVSDFEISIPGFVITRQGRSLDGICLLVRIDIAFNPKQESVWVELFMPKK